VTVSNKNHQGRNMKKGGVERMEGKRKEII
jgi:hypothetical protein